MIREQVMVAKEVHDVRLARWAGFKRLAKRLPNHQILSVELVRTRHDETAAIFTVVKDYEPVQYVVMGDAHGRVRVVEPGQLVPASTAASMEAITLADGPVYAADPDVIALGQPPLKEPPPPSIMAVGAGLLSAAFDVGELVQAGSTMMPRD
jgi:hypothetical protein